LLRKTAGSLEDLEVGAEDVELLETGGLETGGLREDAAEEEGVQVEDVREETGLSFKPQLEGSCRAFFKGGSDVSVALMT
jgi:hypothetical protein